MVDKALFSADLSHEDVRRLADHLEWQISIEDTEQFNLCQSFLALPVPPPVHFPIGVPASLIHDVASRP